MTSFLFWNVMNRDLRALIASAVVERDVDILLLAECGVTDDEMSIALSTATGKVYSALSEDSDKVRIFTRLNVASWTKRQSDPVRARMAIWSVEAGRPPGILLAVARLVDRRNASEGEQAMLAVELGKEIDRAEMSIGHERTLLVGDLNMNPFEDGVTGSLGLHAVMTMRIAERRARTVQGTQRKFFYNPMWGLLGDRTVGAPGTFYHRKPGVIDVFWHMVDQVLLRPDLMASVHDLEILDHIDEVNLLTAQAGIPSRTVASDHLPLAFRLEL